MKQKNKQNKHSNGLNCSLHFCALNLHSYAICEWIVIAGHDSVHAQYLFFNWIYWCSIRSFVTKS